MLRHNVQTLHMFTLIHTCQIKMQVIKLWSRQSDIDSPQFNERKFLKYVFKKGVNEMNE